MAIPGEVLAPAAPNDTSSRYFSLKLNNSERLKTRAIVIASGARYRRLAIGGLESIEGAACTIGLCRSGGSSGGRRQFDWIGRGVSGEPGRHGLPADARKIVRRFARQSSFMN
jgi:alkyl hydroperoxide reductase subunit AhpF